MLPTEIIALVCSISPGPVDLSQLHIEEREHIRGAVPKRQREFVAGRSLAKSALSTLGIGNFPVLPNPDRSPRWPEGIVGSITHDSDLCAVAVASTGSYRGIGIDIQEISAVREDLWPLFCSAPEVRRLERASPHQKNLLAALTFSAKESYFKAQFPIRKEWLEFLDFAVFPTADQFEIAPVNGPNSFVEAIIGHYGFDRGRVFTSVVLASVRG
jgi:4'-phosphopantetheinyl transferase EntD